MRVWTPLPMWPIRAIFTSLGTTCAAPILHLLSGNDEEPIKSYGCTLALCNSSSRKKTGRVGVLAGAGLCGGSDRGALCVVYGPACRLWQMKRECAARLGTEPDPSAGTTDSSCPVRDLKSHSFINHSFTEHRDQSGKMASERANERQKRGRKRKGWDKHRQRESGHADKKTKNKGILSRTKQNKTKRQTEKEKRGEIEGEKLAWQHSIPQVHIFIPEWSLQSWRHCQTKWDSGTLGSRRWTGGSPAGVLTVTPPTVPYIPLIINLAVGGGSGCVVGGRLGLVRIMCEWPINLSAPAYSTSSHTQQHSHTSWLGREGSRKKGRSQNGALKIKTDT